MSLEKVRQCEMCRKYRSTWYNFVSLKRHTWTRLPWERRATEPFDICEMCIEALRSLVTKEADAIERKRTKRAKNYVKARGIS